MTYGCHGVYIVEGHLLLPHHPSHTTGRSAQPHFFPNTFYDWQHLTAARGMAFCWADFLPTTLIHSASSPSLHSSLGFLSHTPRAPTTATLPQQRGPHMPSYLPLVLLYAFSVVGSVYRHCRVSSPPCCTACHYYLPAQHKPAALSTPRSPALHALRAAALPPPRLPCLGVDVCYSARHRMGANILVSAGRTVRGRGRRGGMLGFYNWRGSMTQQNEKLAKRARHSGGMVALLTHAAARMATLLNSHLRLPLLPPQGVAYAPKPAAPAASPSHLSLLLLFALHSPYLLSTSPFTYYFCKRHNILICTAAFVNLCAFAGGASRMHHSKGKLYLTHIFVRKHGEAVLRMFAYIAIAQNIALALVTLHTGRVNNSAI